jgi:hypothetical protein
LRHDELVRIDEGHVQFAREMAPDRALPGSHEADERDVAIQH